ncbi:MAG: bifunctional phosphopantothenoylcysteine decarboxylase/phosphopantothenate--cysteine ligase CoaBC [Lachnospiraceae bacterium]|nr:bifunctional phosphopantothenoylcysteine decarboxylase/phosphopantothenate--cysteine ligase CoaBC [Lachnospiraceae bacterium]
MNRIKDKRIVLGVTGSIAAYKAASLCSMLIKQGAKVTVVMTDNATNFVNPITFETLTGEKCLVDTFDRNFKYSVEHVQLAKEADLLVVAPASANMIAKAAHGLADDMLSTTILACDCPKLFAPAMNTRMYLNPVTQDNLATLEKYGMKVITPGSGRLACGDVGEGKLPEPEILFEHIVMALTEKKLSGKKVLVTAGPTREKIDPVRFISNNSSGKMGYALAKVAAGMGAEVTLVSGITALSQPVGVERIDVESAADMAEAVKSRADEQDIIIKAAAVADYTPSQVYDEKVKKSAEEFSIPLDRTEDILGYLGSHRREDQFLCGFSMETENVIENSKAKLSKKNVDMIVANDLRTPGAGFKGDTNVVTIITKDETKALPLMDKEDVAYHILSEISELISGECEDKVEEVSEPVVEPKSFEEISVEQESLITEEIVETKEEAPVAEEETVAQETVAEPEACEEIPVEQGSLVKEELQDEETSEDEITEPQKTVEEKIGEAVAAAIDGIKNFFEEEPEETVLEETTAEETKAEETEEDAEPEFFDEESTEGEAATEDKENESFFDEEFYDEDPVDSQEEEKDATDADGADQDSEFFKDNFEGEVFF